MSKKVEKIIRNLPDCSEVARAIIIEQKQKRIDELESLLREACEFMNAYPSGYMNATEWLNKPEIQEILKGGDDE